MYNNKHKVLELFSNKMYDTVSMYVSGGGIVSSSVEF